jgi:hypothetical protein
MRLAHLVRHLVGKAHLLDSWRFEAAAMLSQLGCVTLSPALAHAAYTGAALSSEDQALFQTHPQAAHDLIANIPRLEPVAWMISQQLSRELVRPAPGKPSDAASADLIFGANALRIAVAFDDLRVQGLSDEDAISNLLQRTAEFPTEMVALLRGLSTAGAPMLLRRVAASNLTPGMILPLEVRTLTGMLVVGKGQEVTPAVVAKLQNFSRLGVIEKEVLALVPGEAAHASSA